MKKRGIFLNKKGGIQDIIYFYIFQAVLALTVFLLLLGYVVQLREGIQYKTDYLRKDIPITKTVLQMAPQNVNFIYSSSFLVNGKYDLRFDEQLFEVSGEFEGKKAASGYYKFTDSKGLELDANMRNPKSIEFTKTVEEFELGWGGFNLTKHYCKDIETREPAWGMKKIIIDPWYGRESERNIGTYGAVNKEGNLRESEINKKIAGALASFIEKDGVTVITTRDIDPRRGEEAKTAAERIKIVEDAYPAGAIISIKVGNRTRLRQGVKAYVNFESKNRDKSDKLGCLIANRIADRFKLDYVTVIPVKMNEFDEENNMKILGNVTVAVVVEIGNINVKEERNMLNEPTKIAEAIYDAMLEYYGGKFNPSNLT